MLRDGSVGTEASWCGVESETDHAERCTKLHRTLKRIVKARASLDAQEAEALREADRLRVWRFYGYGSLLEYMEMEMGYTPRAALERLRVAKAIVELPAIADALAQGDLSFSAGRELTRVATPETEAEWLEAATEKNVEQVQGMVSGRKRGDRPTDPADPALRTSPMRFDDVDDETRVLVRQAREILDRELGERLSDKELLRVWARMVLDGARSGERTHAPYQIAVTVCSECKRGWQTGGGRTVEMAPPTLETALCDAQHIGTLGAVDSEIREANSEQAEGDRVKCDHATPDQANPDPAKPERAKSGGAKPERAEPEVAKSEGAKSEGAKSGGAKPERANREVAKAEGAKRGRAKSDIPPALRRKVKHRDHGACRVTWCRSSRNCDQHHIVPRAQGGQHTEENIITLCESHHLAHHAGTLIIEGTASNPIFLRREHNSLAIAERALDTAKALRTLGFDKREVKPAMDRTRTHVGTAERTLQQWIKIALSYCPKPRA